MSPVEPKATAFGALPLIARINLALLACGVIALTVRLWPEWMHNPDLSHGFFMPVVFGLLVHEARRGSARYLRASIGLRIVFATSLILGLCALVAAGLYAASVDWSHPLVDCSLVASLAFFLTAGLIALSSESIRYVSFSWSAIVAILLWLLCTPLPPGTYTRFTLALQLWVSESVLRSLHILGIAAIRHGNIIELAQATVGVEEACSGVRSLISCIFAGLFFSATLVRRGWARAVIVLLSAPLALVMNFIRSLTLTLLVNDGVNISGLWHDLTGFAVLGVTAVILAGLALLLERVAPKSQCAATTGWPALRAQGEHLALTTTALVAAALVVLAILNTRPAVRRDSPVPNLEQLLPATPDGWQVTTSNDLYQFSSTLETDHLAQRIYRKTGADGHVTEVILYVAYWHPGQAPVSLVASHTPDACWPGSGWTAQPTPVPDVELHVDDRVLPDAEYRLFALGDYPQYVWFWHLYAGRPIKFRDPYSPIALLRIAWEYGFRHDGDQLFIRLSSNRPWTDLAREPLLGDFFHRVQPLGL